MSPGEKLKKLREEAEKTIKDLGQGGILNDNLEANIRKILHELQVHQLELEMQNEELRRVQDMIELERSKYSDLFDYAPVGYLVMDEHGKIFEANQTICKYLGRPKEKVSGSLLSSFLDADSQDTLYLHFRNLIDDGKTQFCILKLRIKTDEIIWVRMESKLFEEKTKNRYLIQSSLSDVTDSKLNDDELLRLSTAFKQSANSIVITDIQGNIEYANPRFYETTGFDKEEVVGKNPRILKYENSEVNYQELWETISAGKTWKGEFLNKKKGGEIFWELATITPVKNREGKIINYLAIKEDITQRKLAEKNVIKARNFYLKLLEDFPVMVWQCDPAGYFNFFNKTFNDFTGFWKSTADNKTYLKQVHPQDRAIFSDAFKSALKSKTPFVVEYRLKDRFDNYRWVMNHARPFMDMDRNYGGFIATCTDMHDRRMVEERLMESEDRYRRMFEDSSLGIFKLDRNFQFVSANKSFAEMFGYDNSVDFLMDINNYPEKFFSNYDKEKQFRIDLVKSKENRFIVEKELLRKDKKKIYTMIHLRKVYERSRDKQFYMEGFIENITNRKLYEKRLQQSEQKFKALFEKSYDAILILDEEKIADCNKKASELFDLSCQDLMIKKFAGLCPEYQYDGQKSEKVIKEKIKRALKGEPQHFEWLMIKDEDVFDGEVSLARIFLNNKQMVQAIVRDISEKKLAEKQLKQARDDAEKARMAQSEFLSLMSHEIRTPLNAVVSLTDLMLHEDQNNEQRENLDTVKISAGHLLRLIDDILDYNKIESGNIQFEIEDFDIRFLASQLHKALEVKAKERNIELRSYVADNVPQILRSDTLRLKQILFNMISNAIKFTEKGYVSLKVEKKDINDKKIYFEIKDTGIGIAPERLDAIFEKFTQEEGSTTRKYGGSGLGLTICKRLVEMQNGQIFAHSKKNEGSVFSFYIPMDEGEWATNAGVEVEKSQDHYNLEGMDILMVEDDPMNQFVGKKIIEKKWKANLEVVSSGEEALERLSAKQYHLVLMDILLPNMDGYELVSRIRSNEDKKIIDPNVAIIALTADAFIETRQKALEAGMNDFVSKPFDYDNLFNKIMSYMPKSIQGQ